jgi:imidazolonepropionase-like amidohydrolase
LLLWGLSESAQSRVKIACGGDDSASADSALLKVEHLVGAGMTEMEAPVAATRTGTELCSAADQLGTVEVGKLADLIAVTADPLERSPTSGSYGWF